MKRLLLAAIFSLFALPAFAACTNPLVIKDGNDASQNMSVTQGSDGNCQYNIGNGVSAGTQTAPSTAPISNIQLPNGSSTGGLANTVVTATAQSSKVIQNGGVALKVLYSAEVTTGTTAGLILVLDANADPGNVAVTPVDCIQAPANTTTRVDYGPYGLLMSTGATIVLSTNASCFTETASATALFIGGRGL